MTLTLHRLKISSLNIFAKGPFTGKARDWKHLNMAVFVFYCAVVTFSVFHHDIWGDEGDPWVMARETNLHDFLHYFSYTGHPPLWFSVLFPFARLGFPVFTMQVINTLFAMCVAWMLIFRSPFSIWMRFFFVLSMFMSHQYAVVARGYMMMIMIMFALAITYPERHVQRKRYAGMLGLLCLCECFVMLSVALLTLWYFLECRKKPGWFKEYAPLFAFIGVCALITVMLLLPWDGLGNMQSFYRKRHFYTDAMIKHVRVAFLSVTHWHALDNMFYFLEGVPYLGLLMLLPGSALLTFVVWRLWGSRWLWFMAVWFGWFALFFTFVYFGGLWHSGLFTVFIIWTLWFYYHETGDARQPFAQFERRLRSGLSYCYVFVLGIGLYSAFLMHHDSYYYSFSGSRDMAEYLHKNGYDTPPPASLVCFGTSSLMSYLPGVPFWIVGQNRVSTYTIWGIFQDSCMVQYNNVMPEVLEKAKTQKVYIISSWRLLQIEGYTMMRVHTSEGLMERFILSVIGPLDPTAPPTVPGAPEEALPDGVTTPNILDLFPPPVQVQSD